jgi:hypothetical protein
VNFQSHKQNKNENFPPKFDKILGRDNIYVTKTKLCNDVLTVAENETSAELWHKRLGHMSEKGMQALAHMDFLPELKGITLKPCEDCFAGKQHRVAFRTCPPHRAENVLDIVHTDVCSMTEQSLGGAL